MNDEIYAKGEAIIRALGASTDSLTALVCATVSMAAALAVSRCQLRAAVDTAYDIIEECDNECN